MGTEFEFDQSEGIENTGGFVDKPGTYHFLITQLDANPVGKDDKPLDGLGLHAEVLSGTDPSQKGKTFNTTFFKGKQTDKDGGEFQRKKLTRLFVALGLYQFTPGAKKATVNIDNAAGKQLVLKLKERESDKGKKFIDLNGCDIYHVDDIEVRDIPKDTEALSLIPKELRKQISSPAPVGNVGAQSSAPNLADV